MRFFVLTIVILALPALSAEPTYPHWDGEESIAEYARRAGLEPTKTIDLGNGVRLELVLIPAGTFTMGTPEPDPVDEEGYRSKILTGRIVLSVGGGLLLIMLVGVTVQAIRKRRRPQWSLAWFLIMVVAAGIGLLGGLHWHFSVRALTDARSEYEAAMARFKSSDEDETAHEVTLTKPYYIDKYEVTQEQYQEVMGNNPIHCDFNGRGLPVQGVTWYDAQEFCKKVSEKTGSVVRLPTEAEWERACRAGTKTTYYTGDAETDLDRAGWYKKNSKGTPHPVGQKTPNGWGVYDMHGNVWEWCADWHEDYGAEAVTDPQGPSDGNARVLRNGCWGKPPIECRSANRGGGGFPSQPGFHGFGNGFRAVVVAPESP